MCVPGMQGVMLKDLQYGHYDVRALSKDTQRLLGTTLENTLGTGYAHPIDHIASQAERYKFRDGK